MQQPIQGTPVTMQQPIQGTGDPTVYVMVDNEKKGTLFAKKSAAVLSIVQLILGIMLSLASYYRDTMGFEGIIAGGLGLLASQKPSTCNINAFMAFSI